MKLRLVDCDHDIVEANGNSVWMCFDDCKKDLEKAFLSGDMSSNYLPLKFIDTDSHREKNKMDVYNIITKVSIEFKTTNLKVVPYAHRKSA
jgi:hypothetical protein